MDNFLNNQEIQKINEKLKSAQQYEIMIGPFAGTLQDQVREASAAMFSELFLHCPTQRVDYDAHSTYVAIKTHNEIVGVARLIFASPDLDKINESFQVDECLEHQLEKQKIIRQALGSIPRKNIAEISRVYVKPMHRGNGGFLALLKGLLSLAHRHRITHLLSVVNPYLNQKYKACGLNYHEIIKAFDIFYNNEHLLEAFYFTAIQDLLQEIPAELSALKNYLSPEPS